jgi:hypothetical protein
MLANLADSICVGIPGTMCAVENALSIRAEIARGHAHHVK